MDRSRPQGNRTAERGEYPRMQTGEMQGGPSQTYRDRRMGDVRKAQRRRQIAKTYNRYVMRLAIVLALVLALVVAGVVVFNSALFTIENVQVSGTDYLTAADVVAIADIPDGMTLQRLDENAIVNNLTSNPWIESAEVTRTLPNTIEIKVTERTIAAVVQIPMTEVNATVTKWAIASDGVWLAQVDESLVSGTGTTTTATTTTTTDAATAASATASVAAASTTDVTTDTTTTDETVTDGTTYDQATTDETAYAGDGTTDNTDYGNTDNTGGDATDGGTDQVTYDAYGNIVPSSVDIADGGAAVGSSSVAAGSSNLIVIGASNAAVDVSRAFSSLQGLGVAAAEETVDTTNADAATVTGSTATGSTATGSTATGSTTTTPVTGSATTAGTTGSTTTGTATSSATSASVSVSSTSQVLDVTAANEDIARRVAEDSASLPLVTDVSTDVLPEAGKRCTDEGVLNALSIISTLSSDLLRQISSISAASAEKTTFTLNNGVIVAFGSSEDAQSKERIVLQLLSEHAGTISYINVRVVDRPAWRGIG